MNTKKIILISAIALAFLLVLFLGIVGGYNYICKTELGISQQNWVVVKDAFRQLFLREC